MKVQKLSEAVGAGVPCSAARLEGRPDEEWTVSTTLEGEVVLSHDKVRKKAPLWFSHVAQKRQEEEGAAGSAAIEVCVAGQWMAIGSMPASLRKIPVHPRQNAALRQRWMAHFATPFINGEGKCRSVYQLTNAEMREDLAGLEDDSVLGPALSAALTLAASSFVAAARSAASSAASSVAAAASTATGRRGQAMRVLAGEAGEAGEAGDDA